MQLSISSLHLMNGEKINFNASNEFYIITGANNSGKTRFLFDAYQTLNGTVNTGGRIIRMSELSKEGQHDELVKRLEELGLRNDNGWVFAGLTVSQNFEGFFENSGMSGLERILASQLTTTQRLSMVVPPNSIDFATEPKSHPLHYLHRDGRKRAQLSRWFKRAFGTEVAMDVLGGRVVPLHVGEGAEPRSQEDITSDTYLDRLRALPRLDEQGDGMKSFTGIILNILYGQYDIVFLDEPEAFLHPPQARLLGNILGKERPKNVQLFVATHSADFIRGALESEDAGLRIARISRDGERTAVRELAKAEIGRSWSDPILRFSNVIDGLFHEKVVVCEADGDCRFYAAVAEALRNAENHSYVRDIMFAQAGGKGGVPKLINALRPLAVPISAVVDFDVFRQTGQLNSIITSLGADPSQYAEDVQKVRDDVFKMGTRPTVRDSKEEIRAILDSLEDEAEEIPRAIEKKLRDAIKSPPGWVRAKTTGLGLLDRAARATGERLLQRFADIGLFVVPVGEIESFEPHETASKNEWVNAVLEAHKDDLGTAPELKGAREFVATFIVRSNAVEPKSTNE